MTAVLIDKSEICDGRSRVAAGLRELRMYKEGLLWRRDLELERGLTDLNLCIASHLVVSILIDRNVTWCL